MPDINFEVDTISAARDTAIPTLIFGLLITSSAPVEKVLLRCQIQIECPRRRYSPAEKERLRDLFGEPERWSQTLRPVLWANVSATVPPFTGSIAYPLPVPCAFDWNVASCKYFQGLDDGDVPLTLMFSGSVFYRPEGGGSQVQPISWDKDAKVKFPVRIWREIMDLAIGPMETA